MPSIGALIAFRCICFLIPLMLGTTLLIASELAFRRRSVGTKKPAKVTDKATRTPSPLADGRDQISRFPQSAPSFREVVANGLRAPGPDIQLGYRLDQRSTPSKSISNGAGGAAEIFPATSRLPVPPIAKRWAGLSA